ncbi:hypothetical protein RHRU231_30016 [Rhodococcus ruber]|uniref:Uncharacterized protein n=1 Tax=Rhodococcus ruber TaxID=1830 RepID=A0A098BFG9_9NOCA|nr:hypothetical protein RHRU231_30016 [Rhodococcus ruber]
MAPEPGRQRYEDKPGQYRYPGAGSSPQGIVISVVLHVAIVQQLLVQLLLDTGDTAFVAELARTVQVARSVLLPAEDKALALDGRS